MLAAWNEQLLSVAFRERRTHLTVITMRLCFIESTDCVVDFLVSPHVVRSRSLRVDATTHYQHNLSFRSDRSRPLLQLRRQLRLLYSQVTCC